MRWRTASVMQDQRCMRAKSGSYGVKAEVGSCLPVMVQ